MHITGYLVNLLVRRYHLYSKMFSGVKLEKNSKILVSDRQSPNNNDISKLKRSELCRSDFFRLHKVRRNGYLIFLAIFSH